MKKKVAKIAICFGLILSVIFGASYIKKTKSMANITQDTTTYRNELIEGVLSDIQFATSVDDTQISTSINQVAAFIKKRSGATMSPNVRTQLLSLEKQALQNNTRITPKSLALSVTNAGLDRFNTLTDQNMLEIDSILRGVDKSTTTLNNNIIKPTPSMILSKSTPEVVSFLNSLKTKNGQLLFSYSVKPQLEATLTSILGELSTTAPTVFSTQGFTPVQAYLAAYSLISFDRLNGSDATINTKMARIYASMLNYNSEYPAPTYSLPYGNTGYLHSSPMKYFFDGQVQSKIVEAFNLQ